MIIGITGSSGAGKSTICEFLENEYEVKVLNADKIARKLSQKGTSYVIDIIKIFGKGIVDEEGELKRKKHAEIIYSNSKKREKLNKCTFKYIIKEIEKRLDKIDDNTTKIIDAPLLFESKLNEKCDKVIGIIAKREIQIERIVARDNIDYEQAENRLLAQQTNEFYIKKCDDIIENNNLLGFENQIKEIMKKYGVKKKDRNINSE